MITMIFTKESHSFIPLCASHVCIKTWIVSGMSWTLDTTRLLGKAKSFPDNWSRGSIAGLFCSWLSTDLLNNPEPSLLQFPPLWDPARWGECNFAFLLFLASRSCRIFCFTSFLWETELGDSRLPPAIKQNRVLFNLLLYIDRGWRESVKQAMRF